MADANNDSLMRLIGEISSDTKHILLRQDKQDTRLETMRTRVDRIEAFQMKIVGLATAIPIILTAFGLYLKSA